MKEFLQKDTAGMPNWVWGLVVVAGIAAAYFVPKLFGNKAASTSSSTSPGSDTTTSGQGLGLAIDPTTGLPYAVEGLVPSGAGAGSNGGNSTPPPTPPAPTPTPIPTPPPVRIGQPIPGPVSTLPPPVPIPGPAPAPQQPPSNPAHYVTAAKWPSQDGSLWGIASHYGISLARIEQLNPQIKNFNLIYPGQQIRIA